MRIVPVGFREVSEVGFTPDGRTLVALGHRPMPLRCEWHDLSGDAPPRVYTRRTISWYGFAVSPHDGTVFFNDADELLEFPPGATEPLVHDIADGAVWKRTLAPHAGRMVTALDRITYPTRHRRPIRLAGFTRKGKGWKQAWQYTGRGDRFTQPVFLPGGKRLAVIERDSKKVDGRFRMVSRLLMLTANGRVVHERQIPELVHELVACGDHLVFGGLQHFWLLPLADPDADLTRISLGRKHLNVLCGDPLGRFLLIACGKQVLEFDPASWKVARQFDWQIGTVNCLAISPAGTVAAAGGDKGKVAVWDLE